MKSFAIIIVLFVNSYTHDIEAMSCDELFIDCTDLLSDTGATCLEFASLLRQDIYERTGCTSSVGIGRVMKHYEYSYEYLLFW